MINYDTPEAIAITEKAARELLASEKAKQSKYTPAPWAINQAGSAGRDGKLIYDEIYVYAPDCGVDDIAIASDIADPLGGDGMANAQLIAAAPESIEALQLARKELHACQAVIHLHGGFDPAYVNDAQKALKIIDAAIAKALGESK